MVALQSSRRLSANRRPALGRPLSDSRSGRRSGRAVPNPVFYYSYGLFKIAVIVQQIYARYRRGVTQDERFGGLIQVVRAASGMAKRAIERGRISRLGAA